MYDVLPIVVVVLRSLPRGFLSSTTDSGCQLFRRRTVTFTNTRVYKSRPRSVLINAALTRVRLNIQRVHENVKYSHRPRAPWYTCVPYVGSRRNDRGWGQVLGTREYENKKKGYVPLTWNSSSLTDPGCKHWVSERWQQFLTQEKSISSVRDGLLSRLSYTRNVTCVEI